MSKARILTTDAEIDAYLCEAGAAPVADTVIRAQFLSGPRIFLMELKSGRRLAIPVEEIEELAHASNHQLDHFEIEGGGLLVHFPDFDGNLDVPFLAEGRRGSDQWERNLIAKREAALSSAA